MAGDASRALGASELAGVFVNPKGLTKKMTTAVAGGVVGGVAGTLAAHAATGPLYQGAPDVPDFGRVGYVAVTDGEVALVKTDTGLMKMKISETVLVRAPRSEIAAAKLDKGLMLSHMQIEFRNGVVWDFDVPKVGKKGAEKVVRTLGGTVD
jgi:hypothetical protein